MYTYSECPVCKGTLLTPFLACKDHTVSQENFTIVSCSGCNFKFTNPIPDVDRLGEYYKSEEYISHSDTKKGLISRLYHLVRSYTLGKKIGLVSRHVSRGTILDYGTGTGMFLRECKQKGWSVFGMEPDSGARAIANEMGLNVCSDKGILEAQLKDIRLSAITLWHVLEHVTDLHQTIDFFKNKLAPDGVLVIAVPNYTSRDAKQYGEFWAAYDVPRHLYHFEINTIQALFAGHGFKLIETQGMKFDSFYVSMLSEKYKTGRIRYLKAFLAGLFSNLSASTPHAYSSVIYVFKKK